jgi:hypothetical protein
MSDHEQRIDHERAQRLQQARQLVRKLPLSQNTFGQDTKGLAIALTYRIEGQPGITPDHAMLALQIVFGAIVQAVPDPRQRKETAKSAVEATEMFCARQWPET